jgi:plastocyanin
MVGTFTVVEAGSSAAAPAEEGEATAAAGEAGSGSETGGTENTPQAVTVVGTQWEFQPAEFEIAPGGVITFQNETGMSMGLSSEEWDKDAMNPMIESVPSGSFGEFAVPDDAPVGETIEFKSNLTEAQNQGMVGKITIVAPDGSATPVASPAASPAASPQAGGSNGEEDSSGDAVLIEAHDDFSFTPNEVEVTPGQTITLHNKGFAQHDLVADEWGIATELLNSEQTGDVTIPEDVEVGSSVEFYCSVPGHKQSGMVGTFTVK